MHDLYTLGATLAVILIGLLYNGKQIAGLRNELRAEVSALRTDLRSEMHAMRAELRGDIKDLRAEMSARFDAFNAEGYKFSREQGEQNARLDAIEKGRR